MSHSPLIISSVYFFIVKVLFLISKFVIAAAFIVTLSITRVRDFLMAQFLHLFLKKYSGNIKKKKVLIKNISDLVNYVYCCNF